MARPAYQPILEENAKYSKPGQLIMDYYSGHISANRHGLIVSKTKEIEDKIQDFNELKHEIDEQFDVILNLMEDYDKFLRGDLSEFYNLQNDIYVFDKYLLTIDQYLISVNISCKNIINRIYEMIDELRRANIYHESLLDGYIRRIDTILDKIEALKNYAKNENNELITILGTLNSLTPPDAGGDPPSDDAFIHTEIPEPPPYIPVPDPSPEPPPPTSRYKTRNIKVIVESTSQISCISGNFYLAYADYTLSSRNTLNSTTNTYQLGGFSIATYCYNYTKNDGSLGYPNKTDYTLNNNNYLKTSVSPDRRRYEIDIVGFQDPNTMDYPTGKARRYQLRFDPDFRHWTQDEGSISDPIKYTFTIGNITKTCIAPNGQGGSIRTGPLITIELPTPELIKMYTTYKENSDNPGDGWQNSYYVKGELKVSGLSDVPLNGGNFIDTIVE